MIKTYQKKPVEKIQAVKFEYTTQCIKFLQEWLGKEYKGCGKDRTPYALGYIEIGTLEDGDSQVKHIASESDYIVKGISGEFYAIKPDIFARTYSEVSEVEFNDTYTGC